MSDIRDDLLRTLDRIVVDHLPVAVREAADGKGTAEKLWAVLDEQGLTQIGQGGTEISFADAMSVVRRAAYHAAPVPLAETVLAHRLLHAANIGIPEGPITVAPSSLQTASGKSSLAAVPFGRSAAHVVVAAGDELRLYRHDGRCAAQGYNQAGEPRDTIDLGQSKPAATAPLSGADRHLHADGALLRAVQMTGALDRTLEHCLTWVNDRIQFGRPIAKHQAIQHLMAQLAEEVAAASAAADLAVESSAASPDRFAAAIAKARVGEAAGKAANLAHAIFGAMGFTREHPLHYATRRLWAWRNEFGGEAFWQREIGRKIAAKGGASLWPTLTANG